MTYAETGNGKSWSSRGENEDYSCAFLQAIGRFLGRYLEDFLQPCGVPKSQYAWGVLGKATVGLNNDD